MNKLSKIRNNEARMHNEEVEREMMGMVARHNVHRAKAVEFSKQGKQRERGLPLREENPN